MDTLLEANKHASLMRRRDHLRQFSTAQLQRDSQVAARNFENLLAAPQRPQLQHIPIACALATPRIDGGEVRFMDPPPAGGLRGRVNFQSRTADNLAFTFFGRGISLRVHGLKMRASLQPAETAPIPLQSTPGPGSRRPFSMLPHEARAAILAFRDLEGEPLGNLAGRRTRNLKLTAKVGNAFRVSGSTGFRLQRMQQRASSLPAPEGEGMTWPQSMTVPSAPRAGRAMPASSASQEFRPARMRLLGSRKPSNPVALQGAVAVELSPGPAYELRLDARQSDWVYQNVQGRQVLAASGLRAGAARLGPGCVPIKPVLAGPAAAPRLEKAPFQPGEQALINISYSWNASK